jgi:hypothetical protein
LEFKKISQLTDSKWEYEFYKEEIYRYRCFAIEPAPVYVIRALYYPEGTVLTLAKLENEEEFLDKPKLKAALKAGAFDGHSGTIEQCMNDTLWKIGNAIERALKVYQAEKK